jgi:hypothetical protein
MGRPAASSDLGMDRQNREMNAVTACDSIGVWRGGRLHRADRAYTSTSSNDMFGGDWGPQMEANLRRFALSIAIACGIAAGLATALAGGNASFAYCKGFWNEDLAAEYFSGAFPVFADAETELASFKAFMARQYHFSDFHVGQCMNEFSSEAEAEMYRTRKMNSLRAKATDGGRIVDTGWRP